MSTHAVLFYACTLYAIRELDAVCSRRALVSDLVTGWFPSVHAAASAP